MTIPKIPRSVQYEMNKKGWFRRDDGEWYSLQDGKWVKRFIPRSQFKRRRKKADA